MQVLQVGKYYYPQRGGIETHLRSLSVGLSSRVNVKVVVAGAGAQAVEEIDGVHVERLRAPINVLGAPICPHLISRFRRSEADIVHIHLPNPWAAIAYLMSGCRLPLVVTYHSDIIRQSMIEPVIRPIHVEFLKKASAIISTSKNLIAHSKTLLRFEDRCVVIPFGLDLKGLDRSDPLKSQSIRTQYGSPLILAVGRLVTYKGFEHLIRAMTRVDASLIIVGKGPLKNDLLKMAAELRVASKLTILEDVDDVSAYYQAADVFVLPSVTRNEAFGIVQIEAMAAGKPIINTKLDSGVPMVSLHGVTGLTVPPGDSQALASAINELIEHSEMRLNYGKAARLRALQEFGLESMLTRILDLYKSILNRQSEILAEPLCRQVAAGD